MKDYKPFVEDLKSLVKAFPENKDTDWQEKALRSINGLASSTLRNLVSLDERRNSGAFFTNTDLGLKVLKSYNLTFGKKVCFYDPACGAGNLLISTKNLYSDHLLKKKTQLEFVGTDIHKEFVDAAQLRLAICDLIRNNNPASYKYFKSILVKDGLRHNSFYDRATHIVTNPPFNQIDSTGMDIKWASGKVSAAALFIDAIIRNVKPGTDIIAILPDVLRSGSRYEKWRNYVNQECDIYGIKLLGQFDNYADVDVFSILLRKKKQTSTKTKNCWNQITSSSAKISDKFNVSVGSVVDNRDKHAGPKRPYLISKGMEGWTELTQTSLTRQHEGKAISSPFVVIKRTSRHGDNHRAIGILINIPEPVYVDNHLIVLKPTRGGISACKNLMKLLKSKSVDYWIDSQIRCRHLTVKVVSNIPMY